MDRLRLTLLGTFAFLFLMIPVGSSLTSANDGGEGADRQFFKREQRRLWRMGPEAPWISITLRHRDELDLTGEQVATLEQLRSDFRHQAAPTRAELRNAEREIARLLREDPVDLSQVRARIDEAEQLRAEFRYLRIEALEQGKHVLTAEQRDKLKDLVSSGHGRFRKPRGETS